MFDTEIVLKAVLNVPILNIPVLGICILVDNVFPSLLIALFSLRMYVPLELINLFQEKLMASVEIFYDCA